MAATRTTSRDDVHAETSAPDGSSRVTVVHELYVQGAVSGTFESEKRANHNKLTRPPS